MSVWKGGLWASQRYPNGGGQWKGGLWRSQQRRKAMFAGVAAIGGVETVIEQNGIYYRVHTFLASGQLDVIHGGEVEYLIVGGGGGASSAGGGAGGLIIGSTIAQIGVYPVIVGEGGLGILADSKPRPTPAYKGDNSSLFSLIAIGGGGGSGTDFGNSDGGANGGSGGGGGSSSKPGDYVSVSQGNLQPTSESGGMGHHGGDVASFVRPYPAGGGGGAGGIGSADGGAGIGSSITGVSQYYAGGGAGGIWMGASVYTVGGVGGGGYPGLSGMPNTGSGGGGAVDSSSIGGNGGSGIVIVRYEIPQSEYEAEVA